MPMTNEEALSECERYGREVMGLENTTGRMYQILRAMTDTEQSRIGLPDEYRVPYNIAMDGFRRLLAPKVPA